MKSQSSSAFLVLTAGLLCGSLSSGCQTSTSEVSWEEGPAGSISDINRKMSGSTKAPSPPKPDRQRTQIILLVAHDAEGRPVYVETQQSSGDPALDRRAQDWVLQERRFPKGAGNTVFVTVDPKQVPKP